MSTSVRAASLSCALLLVSLPGAARSETVCYSFTAAITGARSNLEFIGLPQLEAGDPITGSFAYDAGAPGMQESWGTIYQQPDLAITLHIDGVQSNPSTREGSIVVADTPDGDGIDLSGSVRFSDLVLCGLTFADATGAALSSEDLPPSLELSSFSRAELMARSLPGDGRSFLFSATISSLVPCAASGVPFRRAETNADGTLDLSDAVATLSFLFSAGPEPSCLKAADSNDDGSVNISDAVFTLQHLFAGGQPIPAPGDACGPDPTSDALTCAAFPGCG